MSHLLMQMGRPRPVPLDELTGMISTNHYCIQPSLRRVVTWGIPLPTSFYDNAMFDIACKCSDILELCWGFWRWPVLLVQNEGTFSQVPRLRDIYQRHISECTHEHLAFFLWSKLKSLPSFLFSRIPPPCTLGEHGFCFPKIFRDDSVVNERMAACCHFLLL